MSGNFRGLRGRGTARVLLAIVFALGVVVGPTGALAVTPTTMDSPFAPERVSIATDGLQGNDWSGQPAISDDGLFVAFESHSTNLADEDVNGYTQDVFYRNRVSGETTMVSAVRDDANNWDRGSRSPSMSDDGRYVSFVSGKDFLATDTNGNQDVYVKDMETGEFTYCDILGDGSASASNDSEFSQYISGDGNFIVVGMSYDFAPEDDNGYRDVYLYDIESEETTLVSPIDTLNDPWYGAKPIGISDDGRYVAFVTRRGIDVDDLNGSGYDYYRKDMETGIIDFVAFNGGVDSADANRPEDGEVMLSGNGRYLAFECDTQLVAEDVNSGDGEKDVYRYDFDESEFLLISNTPEDAEEPYRGARSGAINDDGSKVAFYTGRDFVSWDDNFEQNLYWYDVATGVYTLMELPNYDGEFRPKSVEPLEVDSVGSDFYELFMSGDGSTVVFRTYRGLADDDTNGESDVWVRRLAMDLENGDSRLAGGDRYDTSVQISQEAFPEGADTVVIATGANWPDALCGSALAGAVDGPVLLAAPGGLTDEVKEEIERLGATDAYVLGGEQAVSSAIEQELDVMLSGYVDRIAGSNRYWTAKAITNKVIALRPDKYDGTALVTTGGNYADAMAAAPLSAALAWPILLVNPMDNSLYSPADLSHAIVLGSTVAVPQVVEDDLVDLVGEFEVERLAGANRYDTAAMIAQYGVDSGMHWDGVGIASGENFPDALAGGASLGRLGTVVLLTPSTWLVPEAEAKLTDNAADIDTVFILGGPSAVSSTVLTEILTILGF